MCIGSKRRMESEDKLCLKFSVLLELAASDDLIGFRNAVEEEGQAVDEETFWYGRRIGSKKMGYELRTPLMVAAMFGSKEVLAYIVGTGCVDVNRASGSDGATAIHLAASGGAVHTPEIVRMLLDCNGNLPGNLISPVSGLSSYSRRKGSDGFEGKREEVEPRVEKKEYPIDLSLPDIKTGVYGTDEFRMYMFKIKPCSRAYSHDWTECPFVHPGENARRRDPRKYHYSCVPCPEYRKGACRQGDGCEYAHGIFECWLHPAQYRTRLCKDETGCARRVCFFAHRPEELRPLYASTGSAVPSPKSLEMASSTPPMTPTGLSSPTSGNMWQNQFNVAPPALQLPGSRLRSAFTARNVDSDMELLGLSSPSSWNNPFSAASLKPTNLEDLFGSPHSPNGSFLQLRSSYTTNGPSSPAFGMEHPGGSAAAVLSSRSTAFAKRSQSFIERNTANRHSAISGWSSPGGKLDWGVQGDELNKLRKSASFGIRGNVNEPDVSWVQTLVKDASSENLELYGYHGEAKLYPINTGGSEALPAWMEQFCLDEPMVA